MITLSKLAKLANVSVSTASKAFSGSHEVNEETRNRIFSIAKEHGAFKKFYNVKYPGLVIGVVVPEFQSRSYGPLLAEIQKALEKRGCSMTVAAAGFLPGENNKLYDYYSKYTDVDGIIVIGKYESNDEDHVVPCVVICGVGDCPEGMHHVEIDTENALVDAVKHFKENGVQSVGFVSEKKTERKFYAFKEVMSKIYGGFEERYISVGEARFEEGGYDAMKCLVESGNVPRAVICGYDNVAIGAIRCLKDFGLRVPDDVAVVGYDNNAESKYMVPSLSSINVMHSECADSAVDMIINRIFSKPCRKNIVIEAELKLRESSVINNQR
ncbi:MAG: LacI family DNA-binding transcriptional regulator [Clostridia bacterium]|nr:LacI family DNA-binding transcriptional regulator [Clostridia bacterium]